MKSLILCLVVAAISALPNRRHISKQRVQATIVGGVNSTAGEFPYQISFQSVHGAGFNFCGGAIYDKNYVITAAQCVRGQDFDNPRDLLVIAGEWNLDAPTETQQSRSVVRIIPHEDFNNLTFENDIALLQVSNSFVFNDYVQAVVLPQQGQNTTGTCTVTGWGYSSYGGYFPDPNILQKADVQVVSDDDCDADYGGGRISDSMICAAEEGKGFCGCDEGGPLYCSGFLSGIVSWSYGCAESRYPGVYTEVSYFVDWLEVNAISDI